MLSETENGIISTDNKTPFRFDAVPKQIKTDAEYDSVMITKDRYSIPTLLEPI